jgi:hypothetical protein
MSTEQYVPVVAGKWWSRTTEELGSMTDNHRRNAGHISRIMETELGRQMYHGGRQRDCTTQA